MEERGGGGGGPVHRGILIHYSHKEKGLLPRGSTLDSKNTAVTLYNGVLKDSTVCNKQIV